MIFKAKKDRRSKAIVNADFQKKILRLIMISLILFMILSMAAFYIVLRIKISQAGFSGYTEQRLAEVLVWLNWVLPLIALVLIIVAGILGVHISSRVTGPLHALEKQLNMLIEGKIDRVQLRSADNEMIPMADLLNRLIEKRIEKKDVDGNSDDRQ